MVSLPFANLKPFYEVLNLKSNTENYYLVVDNFVTDNIKYRIFNINFGN